MNDIIVTALYSCMPLNVKNRRIFLANANKFMQRLHCTGGAGDRRGRVSHL